MQIINNKYLNQKGLTLVELLAVIIILAIIAAIAVPAISAVINNSRDKAILSDIVSMVDTARVLIVDDSCGDDLVCTYSDANNEIDFKSNKFSEGQVDFTGGKSDTQVIITVNITASAFKGRNAEKFANTVVGKEFTKEQLIKLLEK